jgi:hypothetical protein
MTTAPHAASSERINRAGIQAGVQARQNALRAIHSATEVQANSQRSISEEKRAEGAFSEEERGDDTRDTNNGNTPTGRKRFSRIA